MPDAFVPLTQVAVLIAARNEAATISTLLDALLQQNYPLDLLQIILINDHSDDETAEIAAIYAKNHPKAVFLLHAIGEGKKAALTQAISFTNAELIVTTDADCLPASGNWLQHIVFSYQNTQAKAIAAPVIFHNEQNLLGRFQTLDFIGMMGVTAVGIRSKTLLLCNGANFAFPRRVFWEVGGYTDNAQWASGDDVFLLHKIAAKYPDNLQFIKHPEAIILTEPKHEFPEFLAQRLRWGTKNRSYSKPMITVVLGIVWLYCLTLCFTFFGILVLQTSFSAFFISILLKIIVDYFYLRTIARFFNRLDVLRLYTFLPAQLLYLIYLAFIGVLANFIKKYDWKGRNVS
ncbi:MAG: hypothetical protein RI894_618 [Bacteroidota bacterium]